jgi:hypothetical protein
VTCSTCSGPSDTGTSRCSWCDGIDKVTAQRDAAIADQQASPAMPPSAGSDVLNVWLIRIAIGVALLIVIAAIGR